MTIFTFRDLKKKWVELVISYDLAFQNKKQQFKNVFFFQITKSIFKMNYNDY